MKITKSKKLLLVFLFIFFIFMTLSGCSSNKPADQPANAPAASEPAKSNSNEKQTDDSQKQAEKPAQGADGMGDRLAKVYTDMMQGEKYYMKYRTTIEIEGQKGEAQMEVAVNGEDSAVKTSMPGAESHMVFKGNKAYFIDHHAKTVMAIESANMEDMDNGEIDTDGLAYKGEGKGDFLGKTLPYEEYSTEGGTIKYYFDGKKLAGMEVTVEGITQILEILAFNDSYPSDIFTIPSGYQQLNPGS